MVHLIGFEKIFFSLSVELHVNNFELLPGSVQVLNIPTGSIEKTKELSERVGGFWDAYNLNFLDMIVNNKSRVNVVLVSDPRKKEVLSKLVQIGLEKVTQPTIYAQELSYLRDNNIISGHYLGIEKLELKQINLDFVYKK